MINTLQNPIFLKLVISLQSIKKPIHQHGSILTNVETKIIFMAFL